MGSERVPSGIEGLDGLIEGGFPKKSLILLSGGPGVGKTVFAASFLCKGVQSGERGVYASLNEDKETFLNNLSKHLGRDCRRCVEAGECTFLDFAVVKEEGVAAILGSIIDAIQRSGAKRLVIDSFSAIAQAMEAKDDPRIVLQTVLGRIVRREGCTTILISEEGRAAAEDISHGIEGFVADGVIRLSSREFEGRLIRDLEIVKLRGTRLPERRLVYSLEGGFRVFPPFDLSFEEKLGALRAGSKGSEAKSPKRFEPREDPPKRFSTGSEDLDAVLGGGYERGAKVLLEVGENVSAFQYHLILRPTVANFLAKGRGVMVIPSSGVNFWVIRERLLELGFAEAELSGLLLLCILEGNKREASEALPSEPFIASFEGKDIEADYRRYLSLEEGLMEKGKGPVLTVTGIDSLVTNYGQEASLKIWNIDATRIQEHGSLGILIAKPGYEEVSRILGSIADVHLRLVREHGALLLYGKKSRTGLYAVEADLSRGYALPKLTPIL
jgi:KaiC/GvpD/RAD55 family RecA-like ATPase